MSETFRTYTLGCGSAKPSVKHNPSCTVVNFRDNLYMIDCGEGAQQQFQRMHLKFTRLRHIFLTHLHGDHVLGLPGLISTLSLSDISGIVKVYTFPDGAKILKKIIDYFNRASDLQVEFCLIEPEDAVILDTPSLRVRTVKLTHRLPTVGYVFEEKPGLRHLRRDMCDYHGVSMAWYNRLKAGADYVSDEGVVIPNTVLTADPTPVRSYAHMSDTIYLPELASKIEGVDLLMHETTYTSDSEAKAKERGHTTARQAAMLARDARVGRLLTGHYSSSIKDEKDILREAQDIFPSTLLNYEGLTVDV